MLFIIQSKDLIERRDIVDNIENKKPDVNSSDDFEINDKSMKNISDLINLKGAVDLNVSDGCISRSIQSAIHDRTLSGNTIEISRKILFDKYSLNDLDPECEDKLTQDMYNVTQVAFDITRLLEKSFSRSQVVRISEVIKALSKDI